MRSARALLIVGAIAIATVSVVGIVTVQKAHFAAHGHYVGYGWHVDIDTVTPEPGTEEARPLPSGRGIGVPGGRTTCDDSQLHGFAGYS